MNSAGAMVKHKRTGALGVVKSATEGIVVAYYCDENGELKPKNMWEKKRARYKLKIWIARIENVEFLKDKE